MTKDRLAALGAAFQQSQVHDAELLVALEE